MWALWRYSFKASEFIGLAKHSRSNFDCKFLSFCGAARLGLGPAEINLIGEIISYESVSGILIIPITGVGTIVSRVELNRQQVGQIYVYIYLCIDIYFRVSLIIFHSHKERRLKSKD